jgi:hypothetical protein
MSKKQVLRKKVSTKLSPGQSFVVMDYENLLHLAGICDWFSSEQDDAQDAKAWRDYADDIRSQASANLYISSPEDGEEW